ncbi:hypothetical protein [Intrasporangium flavum]|uniref:hypothetical protein n=1 Tax=Intrasporangium flavum TaxID=1428657 RepID=UPI00096FEADF|nr:hypothetical protein [Intrasporangium flavum]
MPDSETYVTPKVAQPYWVKHAYEVLVETAGRYNAVITYSELAEEVQRRSSLHTHSSMRNWIGGLVTDVAKVNHVRAEPPLTSLVVHKQDGHVGSGYDEVLRLSGESVGDDPLDRENHAAAARLECYRHWGADVPADATPTLTTRARERQTRERTTRAAVAPERRGAICPTCFMEMPLSGGCVNCS